jgi:hypothetical protein
VGNIVNVRLYANAAFTSNYSVVLELPGTVTVCPECDKNPCECLPEGIDIIAWARVAANAQVVDIDVTKFGINLTQETMVLPVKADGTPDYAIGTYKVGAGKWVDATRRPLNNRTLSRILNRGGVLSISSAEFVRNAEPADETIITFPTVNPRPRGRYAVNYSFGATRNADPADLGTWTIAAVVNREHVPAPGGLIAAQPATGRKFSEDELNRGNLFRAFTPKPVPVSKDAARASENIWFVRENALRNDDGITYTPAGRMRRYAGRAAARAPIFKPADVTAAGADDGALRVRKNLAFTVNGEWIADRNNTGDGRTPISAVTHAGEYVFWVAATDGRPPSLKSDAVRIGPGPTTQD